MPFNPSPTGYFSGIANLASSDPAPSSGVFLPYSALESYSAATSGDIRQLVYSFIESVYDEYVSLPTADRPAQMTVTRTSSVPSDNVIRNTYTVIVNLSYSGLAVQSE